MSSRVFRLYDTQSRQVRPLELVEPGHLKFYSCGPTVYNFAHIGNFRTFLTADLVCRTAEALGWRVSYVSNITDVGHLTSDDQEDGEDRMEKGLKSKEGEHFANVWDLAQFYADCFKDDWIRLNLKRPLVWPRATQHMREQIQAAEDLIAKGHAYETPTGVYYRVSSFEGYGKLSGNTNRDELMTGVRDIVVDDNKEHPADFALWKKDDKHLMQWFSPWGWGFPGWHLECSVMAMAYLGETLDLHAGGEDLIFPHHECEIAQSEALTGKPFSNHWIHSRFLQVDGQKMSKSLGNFFTVRDLVDGKGAEPLALRYALISQNYGVPHNFTLDLLRDATQKVDRYRQCWDKVKSAAGPATSDDAVFIDSLTSLYDETLDAMCDNLNMSVALGKSLEGTRVILREATLTSEMGRAGAEFLTKINALLGIIEHDEVVADSSASSELAVDEVWITTKITERSEAKKSKNFELADQIRKAVDDAGIELRDTPDGTTWRVKGPLL
ncbi:MAG: cysteine--tRNA ligase [Fimbriimonadaceae bacterium]